MTKDEQTAVEMDHALFHNEENARVARDAHAQLMRDPTLELFVYFTPMRLHAATESPEGAQLAFGERVPGNLTVDQLIYWVAARTARVPYLNER